MKNKKYEPRDFCELLEDIVNAEDHPVYSKDDLKQYLTGIYNYIDSYNKRKDAEWKISLAALFGSVLSVPAEDVGAIDLCISLRKKNKQALLGNAIAFCTYSGEAYDAEFVRISEELKEICPAVELHDWCELVRECNEDNLDPELSPADRNEIFHPYPLSVPIKFLEIAPPAFAIHPPQIYNIDRGLGGSFDYNSTRIDFLVTVDLESLLSIYSGHFTIQDTTDGLETSCYITRALGFDAETLLSLEELTEQVKVSFEDTYSFLVEELKTCVKKRRDWDGSIPYKQHDAAQTINNLLGKQFSS